MTDWTKYVGIPFAPHGRTFDACDCFGLVCLLYERECGIELPTYTDDYAEALDKDQIAALIAAEKKDWRRIDPSTLRQAQGSGPQAFDVVLLRAQGVAWHVGVVVEPGLMLHVLAGIDSCLERYDGLHWGTRVVGFYRYAIG